MLQRLRALILVCILGLSPSLSFCAQIDPADFTLSGFCKKTLSQVSRKIFSSDLLTKIVELPLVETHRTQCGLGTCWAVSHIRAHEIGYYSRTGKTLKLSLPFAVAKHILSQLESVHSRSVRIGFNRDYDSSPTAMVPEASYSPLEPYKNWHEINKINKQPGTFNEKRQLMKRIYFGDLPREFEFEGVSYYPEEFMHKVLNFHLKIFERSEMGVLKFIPHFFESEHEKTFIEDSRVFSDIASYMIDKGQPLILSYRHHQELLDQQSARYELSSTESLNPEYKEEPNGHAVVIVGYRQNILTGIKEWKILNSWDGPNKIYWMSDAYLKRYTIRITTLRKP
jgi:hypothetical protein